MKKSLNFNHLYYFVVIAREGSVSKACKRLFVTQPTLSGQLRQLEDFFGKKLFDRKKKRLHLNEFGELVLSYANQIFRLRDEMISAVQKGEAKPLGRVSIGVLPSLSKSHVHEFVLNFLRKQDCEIHVREAGMQELISELTGGELDLVLSDCMASLDSRKLGSDRLYSREIVAVAAPDWKKYKKGFPKSLEGKPFINFSDHSRLRDDIDLYFYSKHVSPDVVGEMDDVTLLRLAAESGRAFTVMPKNAAKEAIADKRIMILGRLESVGSDLWAITRKGGQIPSVVTSTIQKIRKKHSV